MDCGSTTTCFISSVYLGPLPARSQRQAVGCHVTCWRAIRPIARIRLGLQQATAGLTTENGRASRLPIVKLVWQAHTTAGCNDRWTKICIMGPNCTCW